MTAQGHFQTVGVAGTGLIGSSLARALRERKLADRLLGFDQSPAVADEALKLGVIDAAASTLEALSRECELIIIATPVGAVFAVLEELEPHLQPGTILMDVGSVKGSVAERAAGLPESVFFVPAHPVAGTENSGPAAGFASLFENRWSIITPLNRADEAYLEALEKVEALWQAIGAQTVRMSAEHHDVALAVTSHIPHLIAYTLVGAADDVESVNKAEVVKYSAGGFRDFTRIAASDPVMWRDVFLHNKDAVLEVLGRFSEELAVMQRAIRWGDADALEKAFTRSRGLRKAIIEAGQDSPEPNFGRDDPKED